MPHRIESPFSFRLAEKITGVPGGTVPFRYGEARGIFSFEKRMSPQPSKEKRGGISISPRTPLKRHKGAGCGPPLWKPFLGEGDGPRLWKPLLGMGSGSGKRGRGRPICSPGVRCAYRCGNAVPDGTGLAQPVGGFWMWSEVRDGQPPFWVSWPLCRATHPSALFLLYRVRHVFFLARQKENVGDILHGKAVFPVPEAGTALCTIMVRSKQPPCEMPKSMV